MFILDGAYHGITTGLVDLRYHFLVIFMLPFIFFFTSPDGLS